MSGLLDFLQGASNAAAGTVAVPVDILSGLLSYAGLPMPDAPVGGTAWMEQQGLMRRPEGRLAGLLGEAAGMAAPVVAAAKGPQIARGLLRFMDNAAAPTPHNTAAGRQAGALYFRRTHGASPESDAGYMMFARDKDAVSGGTYGQTLHTFNDAAEASKGQIVDAADRAFQSRVAAALRADPSVTATYGSSTPTLRQLASESNPANIVDSAGLWDNPELAQIVWDRVLAPAGKSVVRTADGAIVFDPALVRTRGTYPRGY